MKKVLIVLATLTAVVFAAEGISVDLPGTAPTDDLLQYDDGTPHWIWSGISYFGTWFYVEDFMPGSSGFEVDMTEWWHYHHPNSPWDTDMTSLELWNGDVAMPMTQLDATDATALHYAPVYIDYDPNIEAEANFWMIANTTVYSSEGVPSVLYDEFDNWTGTAHSFYSQDWVLWDPLVSAGYEIDAFFRCEGSFLALEGDSWGAIKGLYQ